MCANSPNPTLPISLTHPNRTPTALREWVIYLVARDLSAAAFFCRRFFWTQINLWPEQLPPGRTLLVSVGIDSCVPLLLLACIYGSSFFLLEIEGPPWPGPGEE